MPDTGKLQVFTLFFLKPARLPATAATLFVFDTTSRTWSAGENLPTARLLAATAVPDDKLYVIGGSSAIGENAKLASVEVYDPVETTWTPVASMPTARHGLATAAIKGKLYALARYSPYLCPASPYG